ncbi:transcription elongation factor NusA [Thermococcus sp.]
MLMEIKERLEKMLRVEIIEIEYGEDKITVYVPRDQVKIAVGSGGTAVKAAELVLGRRIEVKGR